MSGKSKDLVTAGRSDCGCAWKKGRLVTKRGSMKDLAPNGGSFVTCGTRSRMPRRERRTHRAGDVVIKLEAAKTKGETAPARQGHGCWLAGGLSLAVSIPACFVSYYYRAGAFDDVGMIGAVMIIAGLSVPPAVSWLLFTTGRKTSAAVITFAWVLGLVSAIVGRWL